MMARAGPIGQLDSNQGGDHPVSSTAVGAGKLQRLRPCGGKRRLTIESHAAPARSPDDLHDEHEHRKASQANPDMFAQGGPGALPIRLMNEGNESQRHAADQAASAARDPNAEQSSRSRAGDIDTYGLSGFLRLIQAQTDQSGLAWGLDLNTLGLDLNRVECVLRAIDGPEEEMMLTSTLGACRCTRTGPDLSRICRNVV